jgi:hypothetical protein
VITGGLFFTAFFAMEFVVEAIREYVGAGGQIVWEEM